MSNIKHHLHIGDSSDDGSVLILDQDRLCYRVKSVSNGAVGVRTISKALLCEWVSAYEQETARVGPHWWSSEWWSNAAVLICKSGQ